MTPDPPAIGWHMSVDEAWNVLRATELRHAPVVNDHRELVGFVTERHFGGPLGAARLDATAKARVTSIMGSAGLFVDEDDDMEEALALMAEHGVSAVPVVDPLCRIVGMVSHRDVESALKAAALQASAT